MISRKTLLLNVAGFFVSVKELKERGFKFFKLLVSFDFRVRFEGNNKYAKKVLSRLGMR